MIHFFKPSELHVDAYTNRREVIENAPITNGIEAIPEWWKALPKEVVEGFIPKPTMKTCAGVIDYYKKSLVVPLWSELAISITTPDTYEWQFADAETQAEVHGIHQYVGFPLAQTHRHLKILAPWRIECKSDVDWMFSEPPYNRESFTDCVILPGILNFKYQNAVNPQLMMNTTVSKVIRLPFGTPMLLTPFTDKKVVVHRHLVSNEEYTSRKQRTHQLFFISKYKKQQKTLKCPYKDFLA